MKKLPLFGGLRVAVIAILLSFAVPTFADTSPTPPAEPTFELLVLPFANAGGFETTLAIVNPTSDTLQRVIEDRIYPPLVEQIAPHSVARVTSWPRSGVSVEAVKLDSRLVAYVEIRSPDGLIARPPALQPVTRAEFYDLPESAEFTSCVFVAVPPDEGGYFTISSETTHVTALISGTTASLIPIAGQRVELELGISNVSPPLPGPAYVYAFALVFHNPTGAMTVTPALLTEQFDA